MKTKIGTEVAHVTRDSDNTFKVKKSKVNLQGRGHIAAAFRTACFTLLSRTGYFSGLASPKTADLYGVILDTAGRKSCSSAVSRMESLPRLRNAIVIRRRACFVCVCVCVFRGIGRSAGGHPGPPRSLSSTCIACDAHKRVWSRFHCCHQTVLLEICIPVTSGMTGLHLNFILR